MQLERNVDLAPIRIADHAGPASTPTRVIGWGMTCDDPHKPSCEKNMPRWLRELDTVLVPDKRCTMIDHASELCTGQRQGRAAMSCGGDSGGPQIRKIAGRWELIGATSRDGDDLNVRKDGSGICGTNPKSGPGLGIWTDVTHYKPWIIKTITKHDPEAAAELTAM
ncbi:S1 family peptidase [Sphaerisporangium fuscum]|uniref:S1 family peptidase n=1 Tax=Sphaerisporangium fuscum TaxID=2835868 RepID=UPI0027E2883C|nr:trypsin-like serine protease [Sphaerisporangium fuscum]